MNHINEYVKGRIARNKNFLCVITGPTGSGKSYSALRLCEELDPAFNIDHVCFTIKEFMQLLNSGKLQRGSTILLDEFGVTHSAYSWQSMESKLFLFLMQTFRNMNLIVFFTVPHLSFISAGSRRLVHGHFETVEINPLTKRVTLKPLFTQINQRTGNVYFKYLKVPGEYGLTRISRLRVQLPSAALSRDYEEKKTRYTQELNRSILEALEEKDVKKAKKDIESMYEEQRERLITELSKEKNVSAIAAALNTNTGTIKEYFSRLERDGYEILLKEQGKRVIYYGIRPPVALLRVKRENSPAFQLDSGGGTGT